MDPASRLLPLFPLPLVQFPGALTPLHIFEPRYRKLLRDVLETDRTFGIIYQPDQSESSESAVWVGCSVEVIADQQMPDGRSNVVCRGVQRFRVQQYIDAEPYLQAEVEFFDDQPLSRDLSREVNRIERMLWRVITLGRRLGGVSGVADEEPPRFPGDPQLFSWTICSYLEIEMDEKQKLLELIDTEERMKRASSLLEGLSVEYERRALTQEVARRNGHSGPFIPEV